LDEWRIKEPAGEGYTDMIQREFDFYDKTSDEADTEEIPIDQYFPEAEANKLAALEAFNKHLYRPNTYLHKWWARRSGTTFRHILKQLVKNPLKRNYYESGGLEGEIIFDPMMGGGTTLHEAIRMGANVIGVDIDPIPVLQAKATLNITPLIRKKSIFNEFLRALRNKLDPLYRTTCPYCKQDAEIQFVLYGLRKRCSCREVLFIDQLLLRKEKNNSAYICSNCHDIYSDPDHTCSAQADRALVLKGTKYCEECNEPFSDIGDIPFSERYVPLAVVGKCSEHGRFFKTINNDDWAILSRAQAISKKINWGDQGNFLV